MTWTIKNGMHYAPYIVENDIKTGCLTVLYGLQIEKDSPKKKDTAEAEAETSINTDDNLKGHL